MNLSNNEINNVSGIREICGAVHLHTTFSDGEADFNELIAASKKARLDYIVVTDHMTLLGREKGFEGFSEGLFVLVGYEHNDINNKNHYLVLGTKNVVRSQKKPQEYIDEVRSEGGAGFLAHPSEDRHYFNRYPPYPWTEWEVSGYDGIELWNQMSEWVENLKGWYSFVRIFYPRRFLKGVPAGLLERWDNINRVRFVSGIGGVDAHSFRIRLWFFTLRIFSPKVELKGVRTHLFLTEPLSKGDTDKSGKMIIEAMKDGRGFISNYRWGDARGSKMILAYSDGRRFLPGRAIPHSAVPEAIHVNFPEKSEIYLIRNGTVQERANGKNAVFPVKKNGIYRIEAYRKNRAWIYSNPFPIQSIKQE